jgi:hypothetical protein
MSVLSNLKDFYRKRRRDDEVEGSSIQRDSGTTLRSSEESTRQKDDENVISVVFHCQEGSVTHYFHFFYGALVPIIEYHLKHPHCIFRIVSDLGPMKRLLVELPITIIEFQGPDLASQGRYHDDKSLRRARRPHEVSLPTYDLFGTDFYSDQYFYRKLNSSTMRSVFNFFETTIPPYISLLPTFDIVIIQRATDVYYSQGCIDRQEIYRTSGDSRRSISNHSELVEKLESLYPQRVLNIVLERSSIYFQYSLFRHAKVVVAQHGASLANIFFMQNKESMNMSHTSPESSQANRRHVIEIMTPWGHRGNHFCNLANYFHVDYHRVDQETEHGTVDVEQVCSVVEKCIPRPLALSPLDEGVIGDP